MRDERCRRSSRGPARSLRTPCMAAGPALTFGAGGGGDFPRPGPNVVDDGILEPGDPARDGRRVTARAPTGAGTARPRSGRGSWALPEVQPLGEDGVLLHAADPVEEDSPLAAFHCEERGGSGAVSAGGGLPGEGGVGRDSPMNTDSRTP